MKNLQSECVICCDPLNPISFIFGNARTCECCSKSFCFDCLETWLSINNSCPHCRNSPFFQKFWNEKKEVKEEDAGTRAEIRPNLKGGYSLTCTRFDVRCLFSGAWRTLFMDLSVRKDVVRWTVQVRYPRGEESSFYIGTAPASQAKQYDAAILGSAKGSCSFTFWRKNIHESRIVGIWKEDAYSYHSTLCGVCNNQDIPCDETEVPNNSLVTVEADIGGRTLSFFIGKKKVPRAISNVYGPMLLGVSACHNASFVSVGMYRMLSATPSSTVCRTYPVDTGE